LIGISAAGVRIKREENEKRVGMTTTSMVSSTRGARREGGREGEIGFGEIANLGWGRVKRRISGGAS